MGPHWAAPAAAPRRGGHPVATAASAQAGAWQTRPHLGRGAARGRARSASHPAGAAPAPVPPRPRLEWLLLIPFVTNPAFVFHFINASL